MDKKKILIVDDDLMCRKAVSNFAKKLGIESHLAESGKSGIDLVSNNNYVLILIDLFMPDLNGYETAKKMQEVSKTPLSNFVIMSGDEINKDEYEKNGFKSFIQKPVSKKAFDKIISDFNVI